MIKDLLMELSKARTETTYDDRTYEEQYEWLRKQTDAKSQLERDFLDYLYRQGRRLPDAAQKFLPDYASCPDFFYEDGYACVFCDGSVHDDPKQAEEDKKVRADLMSRGYRVVVIRYDQELEDQVNENQDVFGVVKQ